MPVQPISKIDQISVPNKLPMSGTTFSPMEICGKNFWSSSACKYSNLALRQTCPKFYAISAYLKLQFKINGLYPGQGQPWAFHTKGQATLRGIVQYD